MCVAAAARFHWPHARALVCHNLRALQRPQQQPARFAAARGYRRLARRSKGRVHPIFRGCAHAPARRALLATAVIIVVVVVAAAAAAACARFAHRAHLTK